MSTTEQDEQRDKLQTLLQDANLRQRQQAGPEAGTYLGHTHSELGGRFAVAEHQIITGVASPKPPPLPSSSPWSGAQPEPGPEPPLSAYENPALDDPAGVVTAPVEPGGADGAPSAPPDVEHPAPPSSSTPEGQR